MRPHYLPTADEEIQRLAKGAAGLLTLLSLRAKAICQQFGLQRVYFLTREGIVFKQFYDILAHYQVDLPPSTLLEVSRLATFCPALAVEGIKGLRRFYSQYQDADLERTWKSLGIDAPPEMLQREIRRSQLPRLRGPALVAELEKHHDLTSWLLAEADRRYRELNAYLVRHHDTIDQSGAALLVDIGWRGSIQDNLALVKQKVQWHGLYFGLFPYLTPQPPNVSKTGLLFEGDQFRLPVTGSNVFPAEYLFNVPVGSIIGYAYGDALRAPVTEAAGLDYADKFQRALLVEAHVLGSEMARSCSESQVTVLNQRAVDFWHQIQALPPHMYLTLRQFHHDETFGLGQVIQIDRLTSLSSMVRSLASREHRQLFVQHSLAMPQHLRSGAAWWLKGWFLLHGMVQLAKGKSRVRNRNDN